LSGILLLATGTLFVAAFRGVILLELSILVVALGLFLPYLAFLFPENDESPKDSTKNLIVYGLIALVVQLILAPFFADIFNFNHWLGFYGFFEKGINGYSYCFSQKIYDMFPYPPSFLVFLAFGKSFSTFFSASLFQLFFKLPFIFSNILTGYLVYRITLFLRNDRKLAEKIFCLYVFNPLLIMVTSIQGEFDPIVVMLTILATFFLIVKKNAWLGGLFLGGAIAMKLYPVFLLPFFVIYQKKTKDRALFTLLAALPLVVISAPFLILDYQAYLSVVLNAGAKPGPLTLWHIFVPTFAFSPLITMIPTYLILVSLFFVRFRKHSEDLVMNSLLCLLVLYVASPVVHENYGVWMLPFVLLMFVEVRHLHVALFFPLTQMLIFGGILGYGGGLFYWSYFITGKDISVGEILFGKSVLWFVVYAFLIVSFIIMCSRALIKYGFMTKNEGA
jgi:uncharacterized membrane protein